MSIGCTVNCGWIFLNLGIAIPKHESYNTVIISQTIFYKISDLSNVDPRIVDCSPYTRRIALKDEYHRKRRDMLAYAPMEYNYLEALAKTFNIPARQIQFNQENIFNDAPIRRIAIAMNTNSAFIWSFTKNLF